MAAQAAPSSDGKKKGPFTVCDAAFLEWFKELMADRWDSQSRGPGYRLRFCERQWAKQALPEAEIAAIEKKHGFKFPEDYRLFLKTLHTSDGFPIDMKDEGGKKVSAECHGFTNWLADPNSKYTRQWAIEAPELAILHDIEHANLWDKSWGSKPSGVEKAKEKVKKMIGKAPKLIPIYTNRYMFPAETKIPAVLALKGSTLYVAGWSFAHWAQAEFNKQGPVPDLDAESLKKLKKALSKVDFWGKYMLLLEDDEESD